MRTGKTVVVIRNVAGAAAYATRNRGFAVALEAVEPTSTVGVAVAVALAHGARLRVGATAEPLVDQAFNPSRVGRALRGLATSLPLACHTETMWALGVRC